MNSSNIVTLLTPNQWVLSVSQGNWHVICLLLYSLLRQWSTTHIDNTVQQTNPVYKTTATVQQTLWMSSISVLLLNYLTAIKCCNVYMSRQFHLVAKTEWFINVAASSISSSSNSSCGSRSRRSSSCSRSNRRNHGDRRYGCCSCSNDGSCIRSLLHYKNFSIYWKLVHRALQRSFSDNALYKFSLYLLTHLLTYSL